MCKNLHTQFFFEQNSGVSVSLTSVSTNPNLLYGGIVWVCGVNGTVLKTINDGNNWLNKSGNGIPSNVNLVNICCIDSGISLTSGFNGNTTYVYRTSNGGGTWLQVFTQSNGNINAIHMRNQTTGIMCGNPVGGRWSIWKTTNGGINWDSTGLYLPQFGSESGWNNSMSVRGNRTWFGTNNTRIYYSSNYGVGWLALSTSPETNSYAVNFFQDSASGYFGGTISYRTTNAGINWTVLTCPGTANFAGFVFGGIPINNINYTLFDFCIRNDSCLYNNSNMQNWIRVYSAPSGAYKDITQYPYNYAFAVRNNGGITRINTIYGVNKISSEVPQIFSLSQNYPNPFNPTTKIQYDISKNSNVELKIFDATGHQITQLVSEQQTPGTYEAEFDGSGYASGVYFYKLIINKDASASLSITKKMVLIK